jgi:nicotinate-nucleotide pyrophosphorylase (carboxylating)
VREVDKSQTYDKQVDSVIDLALAEDLGYGDITTDALIPPNIQGKASILIKEKGILAGIEIAEKVFHRVDPSLKMEILIQDGVEVHRGDIAATISGTVVSILKAERIALNFLQRLSGIATQTAKYVAKTRRFAVNITDTRKTTPGLRILEKYAVRMGGGTNHRLHLGDGILIKDNHLAALRALNMSLKDIVVKAKKNVPQGVRIEVEVTSEQEAIDAAEAGADIIMLDNMSPEQMRRVVSLMPGQVKTEGSGGVTLASVQTAAMTGVTFISVGALTHSTTALNLSLELEPQTLKLI